MIDQSTLNTLKLQIANDDIEGVFVSLYGLIKGKYSLLVNDLISLQGRYNGLANQIHRNLLDVEDQSIATSRIRDELLRLIDQVPTQEEVQPMKAEGSGGKLCHNIPGRLPVHISTKCVVKIAENENILSAAPGEIIEDIEIARVMEVSITDESGGEAFEISSPNTAEQYLISGRNTKWIFHVKPLQLGNHTLYLQVNTLEMIEGQERKRNTVLEKELVVDTYESIQEATKQWEDTGIVVGSGEQKHQATPPPPSPAPSASAAPPPLMPFPSPNVAPPARGRPSAGAGPPAKSRGKRRAAMTMILPLMLGLVFAGGVFFSDTGFFSDIRESITEGEYVDIDQPANPNIVDKGDSEKDSSEDTIQNHLNFKALDWQVNILEKKILDSQRLQQNYKVTIPIRLGSSNFTDTAMEKLNNQRVIELKRLERTPDLRVKLQLGDSSTITLDSAKTSKDVSLPELVVERSISSMLVKGRFVNYGEPINLTIQLNNLELDDVVFFLNNRRINGNLKKVGEHTFVYPMKSADRTHKAVLVDKATGKQYEKTIPGASSSTWRVALK